jgi:hypothetical protein
MRRPAIIGIIASILSFGIAPLASAHEAYVLPASEFDAGLKIFAQHPFAPLVDAIHLHTFLFIAICVAISYLLSFLWSTTSWSDFLDRLVKKAEVVGPLIIRLAVCASFFYSAQANVMLGPELPLAALPGGPLIRFLLFALAFMIFLGLFTEIAGAISLVLFFVLSWHFGWYMATYANYFAEFIVLMVFGSRFLSLDKLFYGEKRWWSGLTRYTFLEIPFVRVFYGIGLAYAGYTIKFVHQNLTIDVYNQYHLVNFFHASANFIAAGAGLAEICIGVFVILGFAMRWTILISLAFITLSILYFQELLWPHFILYGISFSLLINSGDIFTADHWIVPWLKRKIHGSGSMNQDSIRR